MCELLFCVDNLIRIFPFFFHFHYFVFFYFHLELFLSSEDTEKLHDFEEENVEDYFREKEQKFQSSTDERIRLICDR